MNNRESKSFIKFIDNIWYHYKYVIIIALAAIVVFSIALSQSFSQKEPDIFVYHISTSGLTASSKESFQKTMAIISKDYNGDGQVTIDLKEEVYVPSLQTVQAYGELSVTESFNLELALGECMIYIMDKNFYTGNKQYMKNLNEVLGYIPEFAYDERAILLTDLPGYKNLPGLHDFAPESYLCLREKRTGMNEQAYNAHIDFLKRLVEYTG